MSKPYTKWSDGKHVKTAICKNCDLIIEFHGGAWYHLDGGETCVKSGMAEPKEGTEEQSLNRIAWRPKEHPDA